MSYKTIDDTFWIDPDFEHLSFEEHSFLGYLITNRHAHYSGIYYIPKSLIIEETRLTVEQIDKYFKALAKNTSGKFFALYDEKYKMVWVKSMLRYQARATNKKTTLQGMVKQLLSLHGSPLIGQFLKYYKADIEEWRYLSNVADLEREKIDAALSTIKGALPAGDTPPMHPVKPQAPVKPPKEPVAPDGKGKPPKPFEETGNEFVLSKLLYILILKRDEQFKKPNLQVWSKDMDLILRVDKRLSSTVRSVIQWCQSDKFWQNNILSVSKLRKQFDQLHMKMKQEKGGDSHVSVTSGHYNPEF
ncbi:MAG: hypothetical protein KAR06_04220 [Deltaproteobacteria bacterium]|nr:hypothetical protein [Deltaproteobacteria bacterium]